MTPLIKTGFLNSEISRYWELLQVLVQRNLNTRYRGSLLGVYWSLMTPIIMTGLYTVIFGTTFARYYDNSTIEYLLAAFTGLVVINFYNSSTSQALSSIVYNGALLNKVKLPLSVFPLSMVSSNVVQLFMGPLPLLLIVTAVRSHMRLLNMVALILPLIALILVCAGVGFILSALYVFFRDLSYFYEVLCFVIWIASPVFYPAIIVPEKARQFLVLNPLLPIIESIRQISLSGQQPNLSLIGQSWLSGIIIFVLGWSCFRMWKANFMDLL